MLARFDAVNMRPAVHDDLPWLARAHAEKAVRFERSYDDFSELFKASMARGRPAQIFIHKENDTCSYIVTIRDAGGILTCVEYAGDPLQVVGMIRSLCEAEGGPIVVNTIGADRTINRLLSLVSVPEINEFPRTWKIISPEGLFASLYGYLTERLAKNKVQAVLELLRKIEGPELTRVIFGPARPSITAAEGLEDVFPVPLPDYGMDYV